ANVLNKNISEGLSPEVKILDDVYIAKAILKVDKNGKALTTILNASDKTIKVDKIDLLLEPFSVENCYFVGNDNVDKFGNLESRNNLLIDNLKLDHLNSEEKSTLMTLCKSYSDIFYLPGDNLTHTNTLQHRIKTTTSQPISAKIYRFPKIHEQEVNDQVNKMLNENIIRPLASPYQSPLWVVP